jgi:hypothetical protein
VAQRLGGEREPVNGRGDKPDVAHEWLAIEVKSWSGEPVQVVRALEQAEKAASIAKRQDGGDKLPIAIIHRKGQRTARSLVVMRMEDFEDWFGATLQARAEKGLPVEGLA